MDKMREEFEVWFASIYHTPPWPTRYDGSYYCDTANDLFECWKASRAALCVELPRCWNDEQRDYRDELVNALDKAGVSHK